jgi:hypothetical protein
VKKKRPGTRKPNFGWHPDHPKLKVTKLEIAKRELETCSDLYFDFGDLVSMHVLVSAAHEILSVYDSKNLRTGMTIDYMNEAIRPESLKDFQDLLKTPYRAFKHGQKDVNEEVELPDGLTEIFMISAIGKYNEIAGKITPKMNILHLWIGAHHHLLTPEAEIKYKADWIRKWFPITSRDEFQKHFLPLLLEPQSAVDWTKIFGGT